MAVGDSRIGTVLAGHRIEQVIGRGGASVVYLAEHLRLGRKVALKLLAPGLAEDGSFRERFIRESRIAASLDHPGIVTVYDAGEAEGVLFLSMRYVDGSDLGALLRTEGSLGAARTLAILSQVAAALDVAHARGLVHRDVKPGNILMSTDAGTGLDRAFLSDFGLTKRLSGAGRLTRTGQFVGTVDYVAPEQITGEPVDRRTDVYSLGCVLYECLTGRVPFPGQIEVATIYSHVHDPPPSLLGVHGAWADLDAVVARALAKSKEDRYPTCGGFVDGARAALGVDLAAATASEGAPATGDIATFVSTRASDAQGVTRVLAAPRRRLVIGIVIGAALVIGTVATALVTRDVDTTSTPPPSPPTTTGPTGASGPSERLRVLWVDVPGVPAVFDGGIHSMLDTTATPEGIVVVGRAKPMAAGRKGDDGAVWRSTDGLGWEALTSATLGGPGDQQINAVASFGEYVVAGGWDRRPGEEHDAAVWVSDDDGATWEKIDDADLGGPGQQWIRDIAATGSMLLAVGASGSYAALEATVWTSVDGRDWQRVDAPGLAAPRDQQMWSVRSVGTTTVAVGYTTENGGFDGAAWSMDEEGWQRVSLEAFVEAGNQRMYSIAGGTGGMPFVGVGCENAVDDCQRGDLNDAAVWISADGRVWERLSPSGNSFAGPGAQSMLTVAAVQGGFVAAGTVSGRPGGLDGAVWTSSDGRTWRRPSEEVAVGTLGGPGSQQISSLLAFAGPGFSILGFGETDRGDSTDADVWSAEVALR
jgi:serine/threonine-protein kinase